jgi:aminoglycoside 6'-N-acetyltransferase I
VLRPATNCVMTMPRESGALHIRLVNVADRDAWLLMRERLWPTAPGEPSAHAAEVDAFFAGDVRIASVVLLACGRTPNSTPLGFAEISIRAAVEGCVSDRVAYLEGWYVEPTHRRRGIGAALVRAAEAWARGQACAEMGSDVELDNDASLAAHVQLGFEEVGRVLHLRKDL